MAISLLKGRSKYRKLRARRKAEVWAVQLKYGERWAKECAAIVREQEEYLKELAANPPPGWNGLN